MNLLATKWLRGFFYGFATMVVWMDMILWVIFLWLFFNVALGALLLLATWFSGKFEKSKSGQLLSNDAKQSSEESSPLGEREQVEIG